VAYSTSSILEMIRENTDGLPTPNLPDGTVSSAADGAINTLKSAQDVYLELWSRCEAVEKTS